MPAEYLLFTEGNEFYRNFCLAKRVEGHADPGLGLLTGWHPNLRTLVNVLVYGLDARFKAEDVATLDKPVPGLTPGFVIEPVDELTLNTFHELYRAELKVAPLQRQVWAISDRSN
jgi:hypothetical protein